MVLSSQTTNDHTRHVIGTDVAACWGKLAGAAATEALGCNSLVLSNPSVMLGDTETGDVVTHLTLPFWKYGVGRWERCNISPTGGRQHVGDGMRRNGSIQSDVLKLTGSFVLRGATWADRRIAQASKGRKNCGYGVDSASGQNRTDTFGPSRDVEHTQAGKGAVRNIWPPKAHFLSDCIAKPVVMLVGLHCWETRQKKWITWETLGYGEYTPTIKISAECSADCGLRVGAVVSRFKLDDWGCPLVRCTGRETGPKTAIGYRSDVSDWENLRGLQARMPDTMMEWVGPLNISGFCRVTPAKTVVKNAVRIYRTVSVSAV